MAKKKASGGSDGPVILKELESLLPPLTDDELAHLEESLVQSEGPYDELWVWLDPESEEEILVDGHNRLQICRRLDLPYKTKRVFAKAESLDAVKFEMRKVAVGQRNMEPAVEHHHIGQMIRFRIDSRGGKNVTQSVKEVADEMGISERDGWRAYDRAKVMDDLPLEFQSHPRVIEMPLGAIKLFDKLKRPEQRREIGQVEGQKGGLKKRIKELVVTEGSAIYDEEKAKEYEARVAASSADTRESMFPKAIEQLGAFGKTLQAMKDEFAIPDDVFTRGYDLVLRLDKAVNQWRDRFAKPSEE